MTQYIGVVPESAKQDVIKVDQTTGLIVGQTVLTAAATSIEVTGLDGLGDGGYDFTLTGQNKNTSWIGINL